VFLVIFGDFTGFFLQFCMIFWDFHDFSMEIRFFLEKSNFEKRILSQPFRDYS